MIFVIPLILFLSIYNFYMMSVLNGRTAQTGQDTIRVYQKPMGKDMHDIESLMVNMVANDAAFQQWVYSTTDLNAYMDSQTIINKMKNWVGSSAPIASFYAYDVNHDIFWETYGGSYSYTNKMEIKSFLKQIIRDDQKSVVKKWFIDKIGTKYYLFRVMHRNGAYIMCVFDLDKVEKPQFNLDINHGAFLFYAAEDYTPLTSVQEVRQKGISLRNANGKPYYITGDDQKFIIVQSYDAYSRLNLMYAIPYRGLFMTFDKTMVFFFSGSILIFCLLGISFRVLKKWYLNPLKALVDTMETVKKGNMEAKMSYGNNVLEFQKLSETFNDMLQQIKMLKISTYEYQIETQQAKLQYLQIQIRPHFFLNCLKNIYGLAQEQKYKQIQDMILALSNYLRYILKNNMSLVTVSTELQSVRNYILLQQLSADLQVSCDIELDPRLKEFRIPPLSIQTFVENSVKHASVSYKKLMISIKIALLKSEGENLVNITILDNGQGFPDDMLQDLNGTTEAVYCEDHIGIQNVKHRFSLIYHDTCTFSFSNVTGGACIEIFIPAAGIPLDENPDNREGGLDNDGTDR